MSTPIEPPAHGGRNPLKYIHPTRRAVRVAGDPESIYRDMVLHTFGLEMRAGFFIAYYRNFAIPSIARTLAGRGETAARPMKRSYDTGIVIHEIIANGFDSDRGLAMTELLRRVHKGVPGSSEDFLYVLMTLLVIPLRWVDAHGWRKLTAVERDAALAFYTELGSRMGLGKVPETFAAAASFLDEYESANMAPSPEGASLLAATAGALAASLPGPLKSRAPEVIALLMDKPLVIPALGLKTPPRWLRLLFAGLLKARATVACFRALPAKPAFIPGKSGSALYPDGYRLEDIGPQTGN